MKTLLKRIGWLTLPLLFATVVSLRVKTDEQVSPDSVPLKETKIVSRALHFIEKNYVDPQTLDPFRMVRTAARELERNIPPLLVREKEKGLEVRMGDKKALLPMPNPILLEDLAPVMGRLLGFIDLFYRGKIDERERLSLAMSGLTDTLDPHSSYLPPKVYNEFRIGTRGNFGGLGIVIGIRDEELTVISPLEGTPAFEAGIRAKDKIVQIGEESTVNMDLTEAVEKLRGPPGTKVSLVITRSGIASPLKFTLSRAIIKIQSVAGKLLEGNRIALLKIKNFQEDTIDQFRKTVRSFPREGSDLKGIILDLRNNPGGLLDQAIDMADFFLPGGMIVKTVGSDGETFEERKAEPGDPGEHLPVVVLVNEGSASASEIVAGALQFNERACVIGNRTFGKGSVQTVYDLKDGSALKLTIAKYLTARDQPVQSVGINPDIGLIPATVDEKVVDLLEDVKRRESDLKNHDEYVEDKKEETLLPPSPIQMTYFASKKEDEEESGRIELLDDFPVRMAVALLERPESLSLNRQSVLKSVPQFLETLKKEEDEKVAAAIKKIGVDWSAGEKRGRPQGTVKVEILDEKGGLRKGLSPGESGFIRVTVENHGSGPFYRLSGVTRSEDPLFANLEFPFGRIEPKEQKEWKTPFKMPDFVHRRSEPVEIEFQEKNGQIPKPVSFFMQSEEPPTPLFSYHYRLFDNGTHGSKGNGNGNVERGETIALLVTVRNQGKGSSKTPVIHLKKAEEGEAFIEKGRVELKELPPKGTGEGVLLFRVPAKEKADPLTFDLSLFDNHLGDDLTDQILFPLGNSVPTPPPGQERSPPVIETSPGTPSLVSDRETYEIQSQAFDDREIRHFTLFVGGEKVFYQAASAGEKSLSFEKTISLKKGANLITLAAVDDQELTTRKQWIVWRKK